MFYPSLFIAAGFLLLFFGGDFLVRGAESIAIRNGISPLVVGLTVVAFGTSSPELFISVNAALEGFDDVAIGNAVGSNICNLTLVLGLAALLRPIKVEAQLMKLDGPILIFCSFVLIWMLMDDVISRTDGTILVTGIAIYVFGSIYLSRRDKKLLDREFEETMHKDHPSTWNSIGLLGLGLVMLGFGADFFVDGAVTIAQELSIPEALISLTLIALGTSLPELATTIVASIKGRGDIAVGNAIGSSIFNILAILGITSMIEPLSRGSINWIDLGSKTFISIALLPMLFTKNTLSRPEGGILLATYFSYIGYLTTRI
jgi:cation:H+ antiporter